METKFNWNKKVEMIQLFNKSNVDNGEAHRKAAIDFVMKHYKEFDEQAWNMYLHAVTIERGYIKENLKAHTELVEYFRSAQFDSMRAAVRAAAYEMLVDELNADTNTQTQTTL